MNFETFSEMEGKESHKPPENPTNKTSFFLDFGQFADISETELKTLLVSHQNVTKTKLNSLIIDEAFKINLLVLLGHMKNLKELNLQVQDYDSFEQSPLCIEKLKIKSCTELYHLDPIGDVLQSAPLVTSFSLDGGNLSIDSINALQNQNLRKISIKNAYIEQECIDSLLANLLKNNQLTNLKLIVTDWDPTLNCSLQRLTNLFLNELHANMSIEKFAFSLGRVASEEVNFSNLTKLARLKKLVVYFTVQFHPMLVNQIANAVADLKNSVEIRFVEFFAPAPRCYHYTADDLNKYAMLSKNFQQNLINLSENVTVQPFDYE